jgi:hypothetical protein
MWESRVRLPLPGQKIGFGTGVKGQVWNQCMSQRSGWQAAPRSTGSSWWQVTDCFLQRQRTRCIPLSPGLFCRDPWDLKCHLEERALPIILALFCWLTAHISNIFFRDSSLLRTRNKDQVCVGSISSFKIYASLMTRYMI